MLCPKCGTENAEGNQYCGKCGASLSAETPKQIGGKVYCSKCGTENTGDNKNCSKCGALLSGETPKRTGSTTGLEPNIAGLLCYVLGWITGLIFILIEKENKFVRFHAVQSIVTFGAFTVVSILFSILGSIGHIHLVFYIFNWILWALAVVLWVVLMVKAYQGEKFKLPIAGEIAEKYS